MFLVLILDICQSGHFSSTGLEPCSKCDKGTYQSATWSLSCDQCPDGQSTAGIGSTDAEACAGSWTDSYIFCSMNDEASLYILFMNVSESSSFVHVPFLNSLSFLYLLWT